MLCQWNLVAKNVIFGIGAISLIVAFTNLLLLQRYFPIRVERSSVPNPHPGEWQRRLHEQHVYYPRAMLKSETLKFRQKCWKENYSSFSRTPVDHTPLPFLLALSETSRPSCQGDIFLLVMVQSAISNRDRRDIIRRTWASVTNIKGDRLKTIFFVGRSKNSSENVALRYESISQADIVQADFVDSYRNLTYKHLYALKWIGERCDSVRYVMKVDDDNVINVFLLRKALRDELSSVKGNFFYCQPQGNLKPHRSPGIKWRVTKEEWPDDAYPAYCMGFGYVMTGGLVTQLHHCAKWRRYFWIDDAFVSGALASALGAQLIGWHRGAKNMHPSLVGPEAAKLMLVYEAENSVSPTLHMLVWRAMALYSGEFSLNL